MKEETGCVPTPILTFKIRSQHLFSHKPISRSVVLVQRSTFCILLLRSADVEKLQRRQLENALYQKLSIPIFSPCSSISLEFFLSILYTYLSREVAACSSKWGRRLPSNYHELKGV